MPKNPKLEAALQALKKELEKEKAQLEAKVETIDEKLVFIATKFE